MSEIEIIVEKLLQFHSESQLIYINTNDYYKYYDIVQVKAFYSGNRLIFALEFPLVHPDKFSHYHLYSIPTSNSTTIIPANTYLSMSTDSYQYHSTPCRKLDQGYFCDEDQLINGINEKDCLFSMLQVSADSTPCQQVPVHVTTHIVEQITDAYYIAIIPEPLKIQVQCGKMDFTTLCGNYLITLPPGCFFRTADYDYINEKESMEGQPLLLPEIKVSKTSINISHVKLDIKDVPLDQLHTLQREQERIKPIDPINFSYGPSTWTIPLYVILSTAAVAFIIYKIWIWKRTPQKQPAPISGKAEGKVLFVPDKTSS